ncbi:MAG: hypothetical protein HY543_03900, partial [Deltaproteobacteria bacterium]|nr:hypothetical protein [Deltaproteobacteria bacterium]
MTGAGNIPRFGRQPGWQGIARGYAEALAPSASRAIAPIPWEGDRLFPLLDYLTAPVDTFAQGPLAALAAVRPIHEDRVGAISCFVPDTLLAERMPVMHAVDDPRYAALVLYGGLYLFGATQPLPDDIAALLTEGLQEGWILPVR